MRTFLRRETFIALRARRLSHQIATEIVNPHIPEERVPYEPQTPIDASEFRIPYVRSCRQEPFLPSSWVVTIFAILVTLLNLGFCAFLFWILSRLNG